jgi:hypothetical protein
MELFREGYEAAAKLQRRARGLVERGWASGHPRALELLDSPLRQRIACLLLPRPLYVESDPEQPEGSAREFAHSEEIEETAVSLEMAELIGGLLVGALRLDLGRLLELTPLPRFSTVMLTMLVWHATEGELRSDPLPAAKLEAFASGGPDVATGALGRLTAELAERHGFGEREGSLLGAFGRFCLGRLAENLGSADPAYASCFLIAT